MIKYFDYAAWLGYCSLIFWLSSQSKLPIPKLFEYEDKVQHFTAFLLMTLFAMRAIRHHVRTQKQLMLYGVLFTWAYGLSDEIHQIFTPGRTPDVLDWLADASGALAAAGLWSWLYRKFALKGLATDKSD